LYSASPTILWSWHAERENPAELIEALLILPRHSIIAAMIFLVKSVA